MGQTRTDVAVRTVVVLGIIILVVAAFVFLSTICLADDVYYFQDVSPDAWWIPALVAVTAGLRLVSRVLFWASAAMPKTRKIYTIISFCAKAGAGVLGYIESKTVEKSDKPDK